MIVLLTTSLPSTTLYHIPLLHILATPHPQTTKSEFLVVVSVNLHLCLATLNDSEVCQFGNVQSTV